MMKILLTALLFVTTTACSIAQTVVKKQPAHVNYVSLSGKTLLKGNAIDAKGEVQQFNMPLLRLMRTNSKQIKGTLMLLPGGGYKILKVKNDGEKSALFLNSQGFDVAILDYHIGSDPQTRDFALKDVLQAYKLLKEKKAALGLHGHRLDIIGFGSGGHLAARAIQNMTENDQPDNLALISPSYLDENSKGTVFPAVMPPVNPVSKLFISFPSGDNKMWANSSREYAKTWKGYDGDVDMLKENLTFPLLLKGFLGSVPAIKEQGPNPAAIPVEGSNKTRHAEKLTAVAKERFDLILLGNSITNNFDKPEYQSVWNQFFAPRKALNLGFSGYRTENIIWNIENGELEGQSPKVLVLEIGTNNVDEKNYPTRHTAGQLAGGIETIVKLLRQKLPNTKIIILRCFPGAYGGPNPTSHRAILERASDIVSRLADRKNIFYCDVNHVFLNFDGSINPDLMPDYLHPSPAGAKLWAQAMEPLLSSLMGDKSLDTDIPVNTAIVPVSKLENDSYNWWDRHAEVLRVKDSINPQIVLIGNSITHFWGGLPKLVDNKGMLRTPNGPNSWSSLFKPYQVLNLGFGWDRTQNVLWRLDHGEIDGLHPRTVIVNIGTNNTSQTENARMNSASEITEGIRAVCLRLRSKVPGAKIILMAIFPREEDPKNPRRALIKEINKLLATFAKENQLTYIDIGSNLLAADGTFLSGMMLDFTHPTDKGYQVWAEALRPFISSEP